MPDFWRIAAYQRTIKISQSKFYFIDKCLISLQGLNANSKSNQMNFNGHILVTIKLTLTFWFVLMDQ